MTRLTLSLLALVLFATTLDGRALMVPDITGNWTASFETGIGRQDYIYTFAVSKDGVLTGTAKGTLGESPITEGKVTGDIVTFVEMLDGQLRCEYTGKIVSVDEIQFTREVSGIAEEELVARRVQVPSK